ncbi:hypothetical protein [Streptomyces sp. NPDC101115]|uniref:hypothetical protein n=1 Tax=Streptomyces sp. NPDC101115 TaxID=3366106 RepID=UPI0037F870DF
MRQQQSVRRISLTVAAAAVAAAAVFMASGDGIAEGLASASATPEPTDGGTVGVSEGSSGTADGGTVGVSEGGTVDGGGSAVGGTDTGGSDGGANTGVTEGGSADGGSADGGSGSGETTVGADTGGSGSGETTGGADTGGSGSGETTGGGEPTPSPTPTVGPTTPPPTGGIPHTTYSCWNPDSKPLTGTFVALVPAGTLPTGNKATLVELSFAPKTNPDTGVRTDDRILTRFAPTGGAWAAADPVQLELDGDAIKPFRPVVPGAGLKMPEIRLTDVNCWGGTVAALGGTIRFGGEGGNGGVEVKVPVTWQRS